MCADLDVAVYVFLLSTKGKEIREGGRDVGTPVSVCLTGGVGSVNAVSCSPSDCIHTVPAKFEIFFSLF